MKHISHIISNRLWQLFILIILIATSFQQGRSQPQVIPINQLSSREESPEGQHITAKDTTMIFYLTRFSYTPETWAQLMKNPEDRSVAARQYIESVGGKLHGFWYAFGEYDGYCLWEAPDNVSMAAVGIAISAGGAVSKFETTTLLSVSETLAALQRAQTIGYRAPGIK